MAKDGWTLPDNWKQMTDDEQTEWSLTRNLEDTFPGFTFKVTMQPFNIHVNEDGADLKAVQDAVQDWFDHADGTKIGWGDPVHVDV